MAQTFISHSCTAEMSTPDHLELPELPGLPRLTCSSVSICVKKNSCVSGGGGVFLVALAWHVHHPGFDVYHEGERRKGNETEK